MTAKTILTEAQEEELTQKYELFRQLIPKRLCQQYGISRRSLNAIVERVRRRRGRGKLQDSGK
jgi:hypothetical protein